MSKIYLYHPETPQGKIFDREYVEDNQEDLEAEGWTDTPAGFDKPAPTVGITKDQASEISPDNLIGLVKNLGFKVLTEEQLEAEIVKRSHAATSFEDLDDESFKAEFERRFGKPEDSLKEVEKTEETGIDLIALEDQFNEKPESLTKKELTLFGNEKYSLGLRENMKEATLIEKILVAMEMKDL